jgi:hypothetical protein
MSYNQKKTFDAFSTPMTPKPLKAKETASVAPETEEISDIDLNHPLKKDSKELLPKIASMLGKAVQGKQYKSDLNNAFDKLTGISPIVTPEPFEAPRTDFYPKPSPASDFDFNFTPPNAEVEIEIHEHDQAFEPIFIEPLEAMTSQLTPEHIKITVASPLTRQEAPSQISKPQQASPQASPQAYIQQQSSNIVHQHQTPALASNELLSNESTVVETTPQDFQFTDPFADLNLEEPRSFEDSFDEPSLKNQKKK